MSPRLNPFGRALSRTCPASALAEDRELRERLTQLVGGPPPTNLTDRARELVAGRSVLVTGAGGSIGSEIVRQLHGLDPRAVMMLDADDTALHDISLEIDGNGLLEGGSTILADIRNPAALDAVFAQHRPDIVIHAAALKHLPLLERYPREAWITNVHGTLNVLEAAMRHGVEHIVNISTDKAAQPTSVLGRSKQLAEALCAHAAVTTGHRYVSVRFGNVLASRGSVVPSFIRQARTGGPLTVTHPSATRFLMTIPQAASLVLAGAAVGDGGDILVLDMGEPVKVLDIARTVIDIVDPDCRIVYTGLRAGEKLHEELHAPQQPLEQTAVPGVQRMATVGLDPRHLPAADASAESIDAFLRPPVGTEDGEVCVESACPGEGLLALKPRPTPTHPEAIRPAAPAPQALTVSGDRR